MRLRLFTALLLGLVLCGAAALANLAQMKPPVVSSGVAFDNAVYQGFSTCCSTGRSISITVSGPTPTLYFIVHEESHGCALPAVTAANVNGTTALTFGESIVDAGANKDRLEVWFLYNAPVGALTINFTTDVDTGCGGFVSATAVSYKGANATASFDDGTGFSGIINGTSISNSVTTTNAGSWLFTVGWASTGTLSSGAPTGTLRGGDGPMAFYDSNGAVAVGSYTIGFTTTATSDMLIKSWGIKP
jgi:hypothetical protein